MTISLRRILEAGCVVALTLLVPATAAAVSERLIYVSTGEITRPPIGWVEYCSDNPRDCTGGPSTPRDVVLTPKAWKDLVRINMWANDTVKPITDMEHFGVVEKWSLPDDGYGDCEDYVLLKRKLLVEAGWPREALLITVVREQNGDGHAVLTVRTDKGDFILDNQSQNIVLWSETTYRYVKRQSQSDPNRWVSLGDPRPATSTASSPKPR